MSEQLKLSNQVCFPIYAFAKELVNHYRPLLSELGLTYPQYLVMLVLWENNVQSVNQIGEKLSLDSGTLTPLLKRLEQKNYITRERAKNDERVVNISLTETGNELKSEAEKIPENLLGKMNIPMEDLVTLKKIINKILNQ
ncbi:MAG: MarR family transcriptional regulator [Cruoricaptor ignavus]|nr:MarR family transcriptional regulator [Cruoricaptor ignavus]MDO5616668.1 MarR family transcriptional regulator [Cruoricaptor ignavus]